MKKKGAHIFYSWILLIGFVTGQYMVALHQHVILKQADKHSVTKSGQRPTTIQEKCYLCDVMHHTAAILHTTVYHFDSATSHHLYKISDNNFISISLILASGRAPPVSSVYC